MDAVGFALHQTARPPGARASLTLERFLQLAGDFIGRGIDLVLHHFRGTRQRLVERLFDRWLADHDQPRRISGKRLSRLMEFFARQGPTAKPLGDDTDAWAIHSLDDVGL